MKKILATIMLLIPLTAIAEDFGMKVPEWKDFAPKSFVDVEEPRFKKLNVTAKYWYDRRVAFEEGLVECKVLENYEERFS